MPRKFITYIVFFTFLNLVGCYSYQSVTYEEFKDINPGDIHSGDIFIVTNDSSKYHTSWWIFSEQNDSVMIQGSKFIGTEQKPYTGKIAVSDIRTLEVDKVDDSATTVWVLAGIAAGILLFVAIGSEMAGGCSDQANSSLN